MPESSQPQSGTREVVLVSGIDPSKEAASGVQSYVIGLAKALAKAGNRVKLIGVGNPGSLESFGVGFVAVQDRPTTSLRFLLSLVKRVTAIELPDDAVIHAQRPDDLAPFCVSHPKNPKVVTLHGAHSDSVRMNKGEVVGQLYDDIESYALKRTAHILCVSRATLSRFAEKYPFLADRMRLVYAGIDTDIFKPTQRAEARERLGFDKSGKLLLYAGRLVSEKRVDVILRAFKDVEERDGDARLIVVGEGREVGRLKELAVNMSLQRVSFLPVASKSDLPLLLSAADAIVVASRQEGLPTIVMESLACGTPVVSTPVGIVPEIVGDGVNGLLVEDVNDLARIMEKALATSSSMSKNCTESVRRFSWDSVVKEIMAVYDEVQS